MSQTNHPATGPTAAALPGAGGPAPAAPGSGAAIPGTGVTGGPSAAPYGPRERKIRFGHLALAIALVVVGALGTSTLVAVVAADGEYLALAQDVDYGARITESDLMTVRMGNPAGIRPVPAGQRSEVVGTYATMPLASGTLLTESHWTDIPHPGQGEVRLGVTLRSDRLPAQPVRPGQVLMLVETASSGGEGADQLTRNARTWESIVVGVSGGASGSGLLGGGDTSGGRGATLDVIVNARDAPDIAALAANNDLAVAVLPGQPER